MNTTKTVSPLQRAALTPPRPAMMPLAISLIAATLAMQTAPASAQRSQDLSNREPGQVRQDPRQRNDDLRRKQPRGDQPARRQARPQEGQRQTAPADQRGEGRRGERPAARPTPQQRQPETAVEPRGDRRENRAGQVRERRDDRAAPPASRTDQRRDARQDPRPPRGQPIQQPATPGAQRTEERLQRLERLERREQRGERQDRRENRNTNREIPRQAAPERTPDRDRPRDRASDRNRDATRDRSLSEIQRGRTSSRERGGREVIIERGNRRIFRENNRAFIQHDEGERFRRLDRSRIDRREGANGRSIVTTARPNGVRVISTYDRNGRLLERRRRRNGRDTVLIDNRRFWAGVAAGAAISALVITLGEPRIDIPRRRYIVEYGSASEDDLYEALAARPVDTFERAYALEEIRYSHDLRRRLRRIDLTEVTFESGSWEIGPEQTRKLDRLARAIKRVLDRNPDEIFLIEGHTDAVGSDVDNLSLSDRRAESVAVALTDEYGIPPENLVTQGYGEQYLVVETEDDEPRNRRVAVRRITPLLANK